MSMTKRAYLLFISILMILTLVSCQSSSIVQKNMEKYLSSTYGKEFIVEKPKYFRRGFFIPGEDLYVAEAYLRELPQVTFEIKLYGNNCDENFLDSYWSYQGKAKLGKELKELYGQDIKFDYEIYFSLDPADLSKKETKDLDYTQALKMVSGRSSIGLVYYVPVDYGFDKKDEAEKAYKILKQYILDYNAGVYGFQVFYVPKANIDESIKIFGVKSSVIPINADLEKLHSQNKLLNYIDLAYPIGVTAGSAEDLVKKFRY